MEEMLLYLQNWTIVHRTHVKAMVDVCPDEPDTVANATKDSRVTTVTVRISYPSTNRLTESVLSSSHHELRLSVESVYYWYLLSTEPEQCLLRLHLSRWNIESLLQCNK